MKKEVPLLSPVHWSQQVTSFSYPACYDRSTSVNQKTMLAVTGYK